MALSSTTLRTNACTNPQLEVDTTGWAAATNASIARSTAAHGLLGSASLAITATAGGDASATWGAGVAGAVAAPGQVWQARVSVKAAATSRTVQVGIRWYSTGGGLLSTSAVSGAADNTTGFTDLQVSATAPASTAYAAIYVNVVAPAASEVHYVTQALIEQTTGTGGWFDGTAAHSRFLGAPWKSGSEQQVLSQRGNWPAVDVKVYTGENPVVNNPSTGPTLLSDRVRKVSISRGRQYELDQDQTGTCDVDLDNRDGAVTGGANGCLPMRSVVVQAYWNGVKYKLFTGNAARWPEQAKDPSMTIGTLSSVDLTEPLANVELQSILRNTILEQTSVAPVAYYPLAEPAGSQAAGNIANAANPWPASAKLVTWKQGPADRADFGGKTWIKNDPDTMWSQADSAGTLNRGTALQISGPSLPGAATLDFTHPWYVQCFVQSTGGETNLFTAFDAQGNVLAYMNISYKTGLLKFQIPGWSGSVSCSTALMAQGFQMGFGWDGTNVILYANGGLVYSTAVAAPAAGTASSWMMLLAGFTQTWIYNSTNVDLLVGHFAVWAGAVPTAADVLAHAQAAAYAFASETAENRIARVLLWTGQYPAVLGDVGLSALDCIPDTHGSAAIDVMRQATQDDFGRMFIDVNGQVNFHNRNHAQANLTPVWTFGSNTGAGELPYTDGPGFDYDLEHTFNDVQITRTNGVLARSVVQDSVGKFFQRVLQSEINVQNDADATYASQWLAGKYAYPLLRVQQIVLDPGANPALWPCVLGLELNTVVQVNHRSLGKPTISMLCFVEQITHDIDAGQDGSDQSWKVTLRLSPIPVQYWVLAAMHTTVKTTVSAGVSSVTLNPLPDAGYNPAEASLAAGTTITLSPGTANAETMTIKSVASQPTPGATGYTSIVVTFTANTTKAHTAGDYACDPLPTGVTDPTTWDSRSVLGTTTITSY